MVIGLALVLGFVAGGCTKYDGISDADRIVMEQQKGIDPLVAQGGKAQRKSTALGDAWIVRLDGMTITDETISHLKQVDKIAELHLSRSTITDDQIATMRDQTFFNGTMVLDLSQTAVTDAVLDKLSVAPALIELHVTGTKVTPAGVSRFKRARQDNPQIHPLAKNTKVIGP
jgi:hypothetical protein